MGKSGRPHKKNGAAVVATTSNNNNNNKQNSSPPAAADSSSSSIAVQRLTQAEQILRDTCNIDFHQVLAEAQLERLMTTTTLADSKVSATTSRRRWGGPVKKAAALDILVGRGVPLNKHAGNVLFRHVITANQDYWHHVLSDRAQRQRAINVMICFFQDLGSRYLEEVPSSSSSDTGSGSVLYRRVSYDRVYAKFLALFRETRHSNNSALAVIAAASKIKNESASSKSASWSRHKKTKTSKQQSSLSRSNDAAVIVEPKRNARSNPQESPTRSSPRKSDQDDSKGDNSSIDDEGDNNDDNDDEAEPGNDKVQVRLSAELLEVKQALEDNGINIEKFLSEARLDVFLNDYKPSQLKQRRTKYKPRVFKTYLASDLLFGRGSSLMRHAGNILFRHTLGGNHGFFKDLERPDKELAADSMIRYFQSNGIRFLEEVRGGYQTVDFDRVRVKFRTVLQKPVPLGVRSLSNCLSYRRARPSGVPPKKKPDNEKEQVVSSSEEDSESDKSNGKRSNEGGSESGEDNEADGSVDEEEEMDELDEIEEVFKKAGMSIDKILADSRFEVSMRKNKRPKLKDKHGKPRVLKNCYPTDILLGRGYNAHPGNILFRHVVSGNNQSYKELAKEDKEEAIDSIVYLFESYGIRILEKVSGGFQAVPYSMVRQKILVLLRKKVPQGVIAAQRRIQDVDESEGDNGMNGEEGKEEESESSEEEEEEEVVDRIPNQSSEDARRIVEGALKRKRTSLVAFLKQSRLEDCCRFTRYMPSLLSQQEHDENQTSTFSRLKLLDICFLRGTTYRMHPGNWLFRSAVIANQEYYRGLHRDLKERAADALLGEFEKLGSRFVGVNEKRRFYELGYDRTIEKFKQALREKNYATTSYEIGETETPDGETQSVTELSVSSKSPRDNKKEISETLGSGKKRISTELFSNRKGGSGNSELEDGPVRTSKKPRTAFSSLSDEDDEASLSTDVDRASVNKFLSIGHFASRFHDDKDEERAEEALPVLHELRRAFRGNHESVTSPTGDPIVASQGDHEEKEVEHLAQIYKPSPLRTIKRDKRAPIPIFF